MQVCPARKTALYAYLQVTQQIPASCIQYLAPDIESAKGVAAVVSGTLYDRDIGKALRGTHGTKTISFPKTTAEYAHSVFLEIQTLRSAVFPENI